MKTLAAFVIALSMAWALPLSAVAVMIAYPWEQLTADIFVKMAIAFGAGGAGVGIVLGTVYRSRPELEHRDRIDTSSTFKTTAEKKVIDWSFLLSIVVGAAIGLVVPLALQFHVAPRAWYFRTPLIAIAALGASPAAALFAMKSLRVPR